MTTGYLKHAGADIDDSLGRKRSDQSQHDFHGLGPDGTTHQHGAVSSSRLDHRRGIIDLSDIARGTVDKDHDDLIAESSAYHFFNAPGKIGRDPGRTRRGVAGKVDDTADEFSGFVPSSDDTNFGIDRAGRPDHFRIAVAGMSEAEPARHAPASVKTNTFLLPASESET